MKRQEVMDLINSKGGAEVMETLSDHYALLAGTFPELPMPVTIAESKAWRQEMQTRAGALALMISTTIVEAACCPECDGAVHTAVMDDVYEQVGTSIGNVLNAVRVEVEGPDLKDELISALKSVLTRRARRERAIHEAQYGARRAAPEAEDDAGGAQTATPAPEASGDAPVRPDAGSEGGVIPPGGITGIDDTPQGRAYMAGEALPPGVSPGDTPEQVFAKGQAASEEANRLNS